MKFNENVDPVNTGLSPMNLAPTETGKGEVVSSDEFASLTEKKHRYHKVDLTEEEKNMSDDDLAQKYNLSRFSLADARKNGYVFPDMYKSKIRHNEVIGKMENNNKLIAISLTEEEKKLPLKNLSEKYGVTISTASLIRAKGYRTIDNPDFISKKSIIENKRDQNKKFIEEITNIEANSIETILGNPKEQEIIQEIVDKYDFYKYNDKNLINKKRFKLLNGEELVFGDIVILNRLIKLKIFRDTTGQLMVFNDGKYIPFRPTYFFDEQHRGLIFKGEPLNSKKSRVNAISLESFSPVIFKKGIFKEEDFNRRQSGSIAYEMNGPHERKLSNNTPSVFLSNSDTSAKYYLGREKFAGTNKKINHDTVRVSLLDNNTGVVTDTINGRKLILYTFPLITKEEYERQKEEVINRRTLEGKPSDVNVNDYITTPAVLKDYDIVDYIPKNEKELDRDYNKKISRLSDTSYVLGNFKSFMSETGLAANNYSWREQLVLADALTSVENKDKIVKFGQDFKKDGLRTFLSVEQGGEEMGGKIIKLSEKLSEDLAKKVFAKYGEIIDSADNVEQEIKNIYKNNEIPTDIFNSIKETLLKEGVNFLLNSANIVSSGKEINEQSILEELEKVKTDTIILGESYIELYKEGIKVPIEEITKIEKISTQNLTLEEKKELLKVYESGRPKETYKNKEHLELLKNEFEETLNKKDTFVFNVRFNGRIIAFATLDQENIDTLHIGGLTFIDDVRNPAVGVAVMNAVIKEFKYFNIKALVHSENKILPMYQKRFGFKIVDELPREENAGELYYEIERHKDKKQERKIGEREELIEAA